MSNKEAINELKYAQAMFNFDPATGEVGFRNKEDKMQYEALGMAIKALEENQKLKAMVDELAEKPQKGYEYHYDHTDCIWYRVGGKVKCPVTCSQYRDGWNDAMNYIFKNGEGYKPYRRG